MLVGVFVTIVGCQGGDEAAQQVGVTPPASEVIAEPVDPLDRLLLSAEMKRAAHRARSEMPEFWAGWNDGTWGKGDYLVCAQYMNEEGTRGEFLWISVQARGEGEVTGMMEGQPEMQPDIKHGDVVTVKEANLVDWMYMPEDGDHRGGYTLKALGIPAE